MDTVVPTYRFSVHFDGLFFHRFGSFAVVVCRVRRRAPMSTFTELTFPSAKCRFRILMPDRVSRCDFCFGGQLVVIKVFADAPAGIAVHLGFRTVRIEMRMLKSG